MTGLPWIECPTPPDQPADGECWFCGAAITGPDAVKRAAEHIFPRWLLKLRGVRKLPFTVAHTATDESILDARPMVLDSFVAGRVCENCNSRWMSNLEVAVRDDLVALSGGEAQLASLADGQRDALAHWATKTAFAAQSVALGPKLIPTAHRRAVCSGNVEGVHVVARLSAAELGLSVFGTQKWKVPHPPAARQTVVDLVSRSYKVVLTVGHLVLAVCFWPEPSWPLAVSRRDHTPLWPRDRVWMAYGYSPARRHGVPPNTHVETVDMVVGTIVPHPGSGWECVPVMPHDFRG